MAVANLADFRRHKPKAAREDLTTLHRRRGWRLAYREGEPIACPGCGGRHWLVGRVMAECAIERCGVALPIEREVG